VGLIGRIRAREIGIRAFTLNAIHPRVRNNIRLVRFLINDPLAVKEFVNLRIKTENEYLL